MVADANNVDERAIQIRFNRLCEQFAHNPKYVSLQDYTIPEDEDISYEISVHKKRYEAVFINSQQILLPLEKNYDLSYYPNIQRSN